MSNEARKQARNAGLKTFNSGKPCTKGHSSERYTVSNSCVECVLSASKKRIQDRLERRAMQRQLNETVFRGARFVAGKCQSGSA